MRQNKGCRHAAFIKPVAHKATISTRAKGEAKRVKQDRFTGTCFPGQDTKPIVKIKIQFVDKNYVPNAEASKHRWVLMLLTGQQTGIAKRLRQTLLRLAQCPIVVRLASVAHACIRAKTPNPQSSAKNVLKQYARSICSCCVLGCFGCGCQANAAGVLNPVFKETLS